MNIPSRQFMIQQAVLNAAAARYPWSYQVDGSIDAVRKMADEPPLEEMTDYPNYIVWRWIRDEFKALCARYDIEVIA